MKTFQYGIVAFLLISLALIPVSASTLSIESGSAQNPGDTINLSIILDEAPEGLVGFNLTCEVTNPQILDISSASFPAWAGIPNASVFPSDTCWLAAADTGYQINPGDTDILLATLTVTGTQYGTTDIRITAWKVQNEQGGNMQVTIRNSTVTIGVLQPPIAAFSSSPDSGPVPHIVQFNDKSTGVVTGWWWDFGDGTYSAAINPEHEFSSPGDYYVYLTASNDAGSRQAGKVIHATGEAKEFIRVLGDGWNILSTPVLLDDENSTFPTIFDQESQEQVSVILGWNGQAWFIPDLQYQLYPLDAVFVKVRDSATARFIPSESLSGPPSRSLLGGLNLIGPAPAYDGNGFPEEPVDLALISIESAPGGLMGYTIVISPAYNQPAWVYAKGGSVQNVMPFRGYWVVMENPDVLYGFSTTPIS